jgi:hypothetical protein
MDINFIFRTKYLMVRLGVDFFNKNNILNLFTDFETIKLCLDIE